MRLSSLEAAPRVAGGQQVWASARRELLHRGELCQLLAKLQNVHKKIELQKLLFIKDVIVVYFRLIY